MATICPQCHRHDKKRVEMVGKSLPQPDHEVGDRFPGEVKGVPAVYYPQIEWTCPECFYKACE